MYRIQRTNLNNGAKAMFNKVIFIGRLGKNAEVKTAQNNKEYVVSVWPMVLRPPYKTFRRLFDGFLRAAI